MRVSVSQALAGLIPGEGQHFPYTSKPSAYPPLPTVFLSPWKVFIWENISCQIKLLKSFLICSWKLAFNVYGSITMFG